MSPHNHGAMHNANIPIALTRLLVAITSTFLLRFNLSNWVNSALTTRRASEGSVPAMAPARAAVNDSTSSTFCMSYKSKTRLWNGSYLSEQWQKSPHLLPSHWLCWTVAAQAFRTLRTIEKIVNVNWFPAIVHLDACDEQEDDEQIRSAWRHDEHIYLSESRMESFWASARHKEVFPVPGGPCKRTNLFHDTILAGIGPVKFQLKAEYDKPTMANSRSISASLKLTVVYM